MKPAAVVLAMRDRGARIRRSRSASALGRARPALHRRADLRRRGQGRLRRDDHDGLRPPPRPSPRARTCSTPSRARSTASATRRRGLEGQDHQPAAGRRAHRRRGRSDGARHARGRRSATRSTTSSRTAPATRWMFENRVPHILAGDYTPLSAVDIFVKDLGIVLDTARTIASSRCRSRRRRTRCSCMASRPATAARTIPR